MDLEEVHIVDQINKGDEKAFDLLFRKYYVPLCRFACRYLMRPDLAEDIVSDTFYNIWRNQKKLNIKTSLKAYLFQAVCKNSLNYLRKVKKEELLEDYLHKNSLGRSPKEYADHAEPSELLFVSELDQKIQLIVENLPQQQKSAYILKKYNNKKNKEIADLMNISVKTVEMHLTRAMLSLRSDIRRYLDDNIKSG